MNEYTPTTIYVGNLHSSVTEKLLTTLFGELGIVKNCKIIRKPDNITYAFIEYTSHQAALRALSIMNKRLFLEKEIKVNWTPNSGNQPKTDISSHYHVFVGDLCPDVDTDALRDAFISFGKISNCRIVRDLQTMKSKGYAFVSFEKKEEAEHAIHAMNGKWIGKRSIRTNWSTRNPGLPPQNLSKPAVDEGVPQNNGKNDFDFVYNQSSPTNTTVFCCGFSSNLTSNELRYHFLQFGPIGDINIFQDKGYAFIKFVTKESAARAIQHTHESVIDGNHVKCFWGKENGANRSEPPTVNNIADTTGSSAGVQHAIAAPPSQMVTYQQPSQLATYQQPSQIVTYQQPGQMGTYQQPNQMVTYQQPNQTINYQQQIPAATVQCPFTYQQLGYCYTPACYPTTPAQPQPHLKQQFYYTCAYTCPQQIECANAIPGSYVVQPNASCCVAGAAIIPSVTGGAATSNYACEPLMIYNSTLPQYQSY